MNLTIGSRPRHLEDGDLVAYMDHAMDRASLRWASGHLEGCADCAARLDALRGSASSVSAWLGALDAPVADERKALAMAAVERARFRARPAHTWGGRGMLAAAASIAVLLTLAFGTPPGRAWVSVAAERLGLGRSEAGQDAQPVSPVAAGAPTPTGGTMDTLRITAAAGSEAEPGARTVDGRAGRPGLPPGMSAPVRFNPAGNYVLLQVDARQRVGAIAIWVQDSRDAVGQVVSGRTGETLVPLPDGLHLRNSRSSRADYTITVPTRYRFIRVKVGDEPETTIAVSRANRAWLWTVNLAASEGS